MLTDSLLQRALGYWSLGRELPTDLYIEMTNAGIDVEFEHEQHLSFIRN